MIDINKDCYKWLRNYYNNKWLFLGDIKYTAQETKEISKAIIEFDEKINDNYIEEDDYDFYQKITNCKILDFNKIKPLHDIYMHQTNYHHLLDITNYNESKSSYSKKVLESKKKISGLLKFDKNIKLSMRLQTDMQEYNNTLKLINISNDIKTILNKNDFIEHLIKIRYSEIQSNIIFENNKSYYYNIYTPLPSNETEDINCNYYSITVYIIDSNNKIQHFHFCYNYDNLDETTSLNTLVSPCEKTKMDIEIPYMKSCPNTEHIYDWCKNKHLHLTNAEYEYKIEGVKYLKKDKTILNYMTSEDNISDKEAYDIFKFIVNFEVFKNFAEIKTEVKNLSNKDIQETKNLSRYEKKKKSTIPITFMDKTFYTTSINNNDFMVNGHFRMQKIGKNRSDVKLIWIDNFTKHGYIRKAKLEKLNNS